MSGVTSPRLGTVPIGREKDSVWLTRFSSRRLSDGDGLGQLGRRAAVGPEDLVESMAVERASERGQWP